MDPASINWLAVLAASVVGFAVGMVWYGPLFGSAWMRAIGMDPEAAKNMPKKGIQRIFMISFILQWVMALCLAAFIGVEPGALEGAFYGLLTGLPWIGFAIAINALYEQKSAIYIFINMGYWTLTFTIMGLIIGAWQ